MPVRATPDITITWLPDAATSASRRSAISSSVNASILFSTVTRGLSANPPP
jgi:hypothetical protein